MRVFNPVVGMTVPWHIRALLIFVPIKWSGTEPIEGFKTTWSIGYKNLFGVTYIVKEKQK